MSSIRPHAAAAVALTMAVVATLSCKENKNCSLTDPCTPPSATIQSPTDGQTFQAGEAIEFRGTGTSEGKPLSDASLTWSSNHEGSLGSGRTRSRADLSVGQHTITLTATDAKGSKGTDAVTISIEAAVQLSAPVVKIDAPADGEVFQVGAAVELIGSATDSEDGPIPASGLAWSSNLDGALGIGPSLSRDNLALGVHTITLTATDSDGMPGTATVSITVTESPPPSVLITAPAAGTLFVEGSAIAFEGSAEDGDGNALTGAALVWTSSLDGQIGTGMSTTRSDLSLGQHTITLAATDANGLSASVSVSISVVASGVPIVSISSPAANSEHEHDTAVSFQGSATDPEDGTLSGGALVWTSSVNGQIGTGTEFSRSDLSSGPHAITLTATDSDGNAASSQRSITKTSSATGTR